MDSNMPIVQISFKILENVHVTFLGKSLHVFSI